MSKRLSILAYDEVTFQDPRVADMAALALSKRWPAKYSFTRR